MARLQTPPMLTLWRRLRIGLNEHVVVLISALVIRA